MAARPRIRVPSLVKPKEGEQGKTTLEEVFKSKQGKLALAPEQSEYDIFSEKIKIDRSSLDDAVVEQAQVFLEVGQRHVQAISLYDEAQKRLARCDAEIAGVVRRDLGKDGARVTEAMINDAITLNTEHINISFEAAELKKQVALWNILREAFDHRLKMIKELVNLYAMGHYATSSVGITGGAREAMTANAKARLNEDRRSRANG